MTTLADIQFTPTQLAELDRVDPDLIQEWLAVLTTTPNVRSPAGWLLAAIRTGKPPGAAVDVRQRLATQRAEHLIGNQGANWHNEHEAVAELFGPPEMTADIATLERIDQTLTPDQRVLIGRSLAQQLAYTKLNGRRTIRDSGGPLHHHDTPQLRTRMLTLWQAQRERLEQAEAAAAERARHAADQAAEATALHEPEHFTDELEPAARPTPETP